MNNFENRYNSFFGENTFNKLLKKQRELYKLNYIRINTSKTKSKKIEEFFKNKKVIYEKGFLPNSYIIKKTFFSLSSTVPALTQEIYSQELASQLPVNIIPNLNKVQMDARNSSSKNFSADFKQLKKKINILDMAAAPGSKITQLIDRLNAIGMEYSITALEPNQKRHTKLINNIQRQECENVNIINCSGENFKSSVKFDLIMLDTPCSGNLIGDVDWLKKRSLKGIEEKALLQKKLIKNAIGLLNEKGLLVYSTCSMEPEENEENILWAKKELNLKEVESEFNFPFKVKASELFVGESQKKYTELKSVRLMPYESNTQGFFVSMLKKKIKE